MLVLLFPRVIVLVLLFPRVIMLVLLFPRVIVPIPSYPQGHCVVPVLSPVTLQYSVSILSLGVIFLIPSYPSVIVLVPSYSRGRCAGSVQSLCSWACPIPDFFPTRCCLLLNKSSLVLLIPGRIFEILIKMSAHLISLL
jgi:hypothetical protein